MQFRLVAAHPIVLGFVDWCHYEATCPLESRPPLEAEEQVKASRAEQRHKRDAIQISPLLNPWYNFIEEIGRYKIQISAMEMHSTSRAPRKSEIRISNFQESKFSLILLHYLHIYICIYIYIFFCLTTFAKIYCGVLLRASIYAGIRPSVCTSNI